MIAQRVALATLSVLSASIGCGSAPSTVSAPPTASAVAAPVAALGAEPPLCPPLEEQPTRVQASARLQRVPTGFVVGFDIDADGKLAIVSEGDAVQLWDVATLTLQSTLPAPSMFTGSGRWATAIWDPKAGGLRVFHAGQQMVIARDGTSRETAQKIQYPKGLDISSVWELAVNRGGAFAAHFDPLGDKKPSVAIWPNGEPAAAPVVVAFSDEPTDIELASGAPVLVVSSRKVPTEDDDAEDDAEDDAKDDAKGIATRYYLLDTSRPSAPPKRFFSLPGYGSILAVSSDAALVVTSQRGGAAQIVETGSGKVRATLQVPYSSASARSAKVFETGAFTIDGHTVVVMSGSTLASYDAKTGRLLANVGARVALRSKLLYAGANRLVTHHDDGASVWSTLDGSLVGRPRLPRDNMLAAYSNGDILATTWGNSGRCLQTEVAVTLRRVAIDSSEDTPFVALAEPGATPKWPLVVGEATSFCAQGFPMLVAPDAGKLVVGRIGKPPVVLDLPTNGQLELPGSKESMANPLSVDGRWVAVETNQKDLKIVDTTTGKEALPGLMAALPRQPSGARRLMWWAIAPDRTSVTVLHDNHHVTLVQANGKVIASHRFDSRPNLIDYASPKRVVVTLDDGTFVVLDDGVITHQKPTPGGGVEALAIAPGGATAAALGMDRFTHIVDLESASIRASLVDFVDQEYIALTPNGAYSGTAEVAQRLGWAFEAPSEVFGFELFAAALERPDVVAKRLAGDLSDLPSGLVRPPTLVETAPPRRSADGGSVTLSLEASSSFRVDAVRVYVEGRPAAAQAVCKRADKVEVTAALLPGQNNVAAVAFDAIGYSSRPLVVQVEGPVDEARPDVWVVALGISSYPLLGADQQLEAADDDARSIAALFESIAGPAQLFAAAHVRVLTDAAVTHAAVEEALRSSEQMKPSDLLVVFLSGHGDKPSESEETMLVTGASDGTEESLRKTGIGWGVVGAALKKAKGRTLVLMDACHAGHVSRSIVAPNELLARALEREHRAGAFVFAASKGRQASYEANTKKGIKRTKRTDLAVPSDRVQGLFTGAFVESVRAKATDRNGDGLIQLSELVDEVRGRVELASDGAQVPWVVSRSSFGDFAVARLTP